MSMILLSDVKWTRFGAREGPIFIGHFPYELSSDALVRDKFLKVVASAEGGCFDSVNMYD